MIDLVNSERDARSREYEILETAHHTPIFSDIRYCSAIMGRKTRIRGDRSRTGLASQHVETFEKVGGISNLSQAKRVVGTKDFHA